MVQLDTSCALDYDEMSAFLSKMDDTWMLDLPLSKALVAVSDISPCNKVIRSKKPRRYKRLEILSTRRELTKLELQLQILKEKHELYESLNAAKSSCGLHWRLFASREQILMKRSTQTNARLHKCMIGNSQIIRRVRQLVQRQLIEIVPTSVQSSYRIVGLDNEMNVRRTMQACLDIRSKYQVDSIMKQCDGGLDAASHDQQTNEWNSFAFGNSGLGVEFCESVALPFCASFIKSAMSNWPSKRREHRQDKHVLNDGMHGEATELNRRLILQRLVQLRGRTLVLWEDAFCYESDASTSSVKFMIRGSGWAAISPVEGHIDDLSVVYSGGFLQIHPTDQSNLQTSDQLSYHIISYTQALHRSRMTSLEDILMDIVRQ